MISKSFPYSIFNVIFLLCLLNQLQQTNAMARSNETDHVSLMAIKDGIEGLSSWNRSFHFCQWQGITCSKLHQRVMSLNLSSQNLVGSLSPHIGNLSFLRFINLESNKFYGEIPQEIGRLFRLQTLIMRNNSFAGEIPVNLTQCSDLKIVLLRTNMLSGNVPAQLGSLSKLVALDLYTNRLIGEVPPSLGNLSSLRYLNLASNNLEGSIPNALGRMSSLTFLSLELNELSGKVPSSLYNFSSVYSFSIALNQFTGNLPPDLGITLPNIVEFVVSGNKLSGPLPVSLANASKMEYFDATLNNFTGNIPTSLGVLQNISWINLGNNNLGRGEVDDLSFITSLTNCSNLNHLILHFNTLRGVIPNSIANLSTQMEMLILGHNQISGIIPEGIGNLVNLIGLGLEANNFHGSIPSSIGDIHKLQVLYLHKNKFNGLIPSSLANLTQLSMLNIQKNNLEGSIPSNLGGYQHLQGLLFSENNLNGTIPKQIFGIPSLSLVLDLSMNSFSGPLPVEVGNLKQLGSLDVSGNKLSGEIPVTLANCLSLEQLSLSNNFFDGTIPQSLSSLKSIQYLDLSSNNLSGQIPKFLVNISNLQYLNLSFNKLEGEVPMKGIFTNVSAMSVDGNFKLCGGIHELQLTRCSIKNSKKQGKSVVFILAIAMGAALFFILASSLLILCWKRKTKLKSSSSTLKHQNMKLSYRDLFEATGGFSVGNLLGSGSFGHVYKGMLSDDEVVAVKVFNLERKDASKVFLAECESLRAIRHRNLVKVLNSCSSMDFKGNDFKALVFEFMPNGSLEKWLYQDSDGQDALLGYLNVFQRINIAIDVSFALKYLHHEGQISIVHRDLKPSNVLLDNDMVAHVSDFGLAKLLSRWEESSTMNQSTSMCVKGSIGYAAPEYGMGSDASIHGDVYSYGVLLLEMFIGRRPTDEMFKDGLNLHNYAREGFLDRAIQIVDPILLSGEDESSGDSNGIKGGRNKVIDSIYEVIRIGVACSMESPTERMDMRDVNRKLLVIKESFLGTRMDG